MLVLTGACAFEGGGSGAPAVDALPSDAATVGGDAGPPVDGPPQSVDGARARRFGDSCSESDDCASVLCVEAVCTVSCEWEEPNDCRDVGGFCVPLTDGGRACMGDLSTGPDREDAIVHLGEAIANLEMVPLADADLFQVLLPIGESFAIATPELGIDVEIDVYDEAARLLARVFSHGPGEPETATITVPASLVPPVRGFVVVKNVGTNTGLYTFSLTRTPPAATP